MDRTADHYRILGVSTEARHEELRAAYRAKLRLWHPDLVADETEDARQAATEMTARLNEAYGCLSDPARRSAYDTSRGVVGTTVPRKAEQTSPSRRARSTLRPGRRRRGVITISLGGIVLPLLVVAWASGQMPVQAAVNGPLIASVCTGVIAATIWLLLSSRLLCQPQRLGRIGVVWSHLMRWAGWILIGGCAVFLGIPAFFLVLMAVFALPFFGLVVLALISGRFDSHIR